MKNELLTNIGRIENIRLEFTNGRIEKFSSKTNLNLLKHTLEQEADNRRIGEFGIGMNHKITKYIKDILFDEKIYGTIYLALGRSYTDKRGGGLNKGTIHWDMIKA